MEQPKTNTEEIKQKTPKSAEAKKEINIEDIDKILDIEEGILDNLNKYSKDEIFKNVDFKDTLKFREGGVVDEKFDEITYGKATLQEKILNFATFGLAKKNLGFIKSKERGLLNQDIFNKEIEGKKIEIGQNKEERSGMEKIIGNLRKELSPEDLGERQITKKFEFVDGKIIKIVQASRTEQGMIDAAGKLRDEKINEADKLGVDIVKSKEQLEKHLNDKSKLENLKYLNAEGKEDLRIKMLEEETNLGNSIKDKETELKDKLNIFKEPLEERMSQTHELLGKISGTFESVKKEETELSKNLREIDSEIKLIERSGILEETKKQILDNLKAEGHEMVNNLSELTQRKSELEKKLNILKTNERDLGKELSKINKIGKTKKEILEEEKAQKEAKTGGENNATENKETKQTTKDMAEDFSFMKGQKIGEEEKERKDKKLSENINKENILYDLTDEEDKEDINKIIDSYLTKKAPEKKKDKGFLAGFIKNIFGSLFELKKINVPINEKRILKETDIIFKKNQKKEPKFKPAK